MRHNQALKNQLAAHLKGGMAFLPVDKMLEEIPFEKTGLVPDGLPYSFWQQFWHMRIAQKDIIDFSFNEDYSEPSWPDDYWPANPAPASREEWENAIRDFFNDRDWLAERIQDESVDLFAPLKNDSPKNLLREVLLVIEHNAYHAGQLLVILRQLRLHE